MDVSVSESTKIAISDSELKENILEVPWYQVNCSGVVKQFNSRISTDFPA